MHRLWRVFLILFFLYVEISTGQTSDVDINEWTDDLRNVLHYFEIVNLPDVKHRTKRYADPVSTEGFHQVWIKAFGRMFHLSMKKSTILSHDFHTSIVHGNGSSHSYLSSSYDFYSGTLHGETDTHANVYWEDGILTASVVTPGDVYFIEPAKRYLSEAHNESLIAYRKSDIKIADEPWDGHGFYTGRKSSNSLSKNLTDNHQHYKIRQGPTDRHKRALDFGSRRFCRILLVADHYFYEGVGHGSILATQNYMIGVMDRVNHIFQSTKWPDDSGTAGLGFEISRIIIHDEPTQGEDEHFNMADRPQDMDKTLDYFSKARYLNSDCVVHLFTYASFQTGLGLAYTASWRSGEFGGLCSPMDYYLKMAGNTGLTTVKNRAGNRVLTLQSTITTAHELGHNWGSVHDNADSSECGDFYIMYPTSQEGSGINNLVFSPCSRRSVYEVLKSKEHLVGCMKEKNPFFAFCGNGRIDSGEECDSGTRPDECCTDKCLLKPGADCSPFNKACCSNCKLAPVNTVCLQNVDDDFDCQGSAVCNGYQYDCPSPTSKSDNTSCHGAGKCVGGVCVGFCEQKGMEPCVCSPDSGQACLRCCRQMSDSQCVSFRELLEDGRTCYQGYCQKGVCIKSPSQVNKFWKALSVQIVDGFGVFMRDNIVFFITLFSVILWLPTVIIIECVENKKKKAADKMINRHLNTSMRDKVDILADEKVDKILHIGRRSLPAIREASRYQGSVLKDENAEMRTFEPDTEIAGHSGRPRVNERRVNDITLTVNNNLYSNSSYQTNSLPLTNHRSQYRQNREVLAERHPHNKKTYGNGSAYLNDDRKVSTLPTSHRYPGNTPNFTSNTLDRYTLGMKQRPTDQGLSEGNYGSSNMVQSTAQRMHTEDFQRPRRQMVDPSTSSHQFIPIKHRPVSDESDYESTPRNNGSRPNEDLALTGHDYQPSNHGNKLQGEAIFNSLSTVTYDSRERLVKPSVGYAQGGDVYSNQGFSPSDDFVQETMI